MNHRGSRWLGLSLLLLGCSSTGVGNPGVAQLSLISDPDVEPAVTDDAEQLASEDLQHAILVIQKLQFLACDSQEHDMVAAGPFVVDLAQNRCEPAIPTLTLPSGGFCGIDATLGPAAAPAALAGRSMFFSGLRNDGTLFLLYADMPGTLRMRPLSGIDWANGDDAHWIWAMRPRRWLLPSELADVEAETLGGVRRIIPIDVNRHPALYQAIRTRIAQRSTLHIDLNQNGQLDPDERLDDALIGEGLGSID